MIASGRTDPGGALERETPGGGGDDNPIATRRLPLDGAMLPVPPAARLDASL
jgi:hypothetical protein